MENEELQTWIFQMEFSWILRNELHSTRFCFLYKIEKYVCLFGITSTAKIFKGL